jgi:hypothetical protein
MTIVYRSSKGVDLVPSEVDGNFSELDTRTAEGWRDLVCGLETRSGPSEPVLQNFRNGVYLYSFSSDVVQEAFAMAHIDHDYKLGSELFPHMHWTTDTTNTGTVRWGMEYTWARRFDDTGVTEFGPTNTIYVEQSAQNVAYRHYVAQPTVGNGIDGTGMNIDTVILIRVFRDAEHVNDTYPDSVYGITFDLHYQCERYATPNKDPNFFV